MNSAVQIIQANDDDLDRLISMGERMQSDERRYEPLLTFDRDTSREHYAHELRNPNALIILAVLEDGSYAGYQYSYVHEIDYLSSGNRECVLEALYVEPRSREQGIGVALTKYAQNWAINTKEVNRLVAHIYSNNEVSIKLHEKDGFRPYNLELIKYT